MTRSSSEAFLLDLAERTFLKLWTVPNSFYAPNKELSDLIVPFGDDVLIISDKATRFDFDGPLNVSWARWYRNAIGDSLRQLKTAMQRVKRSPDGVFTDVDARSPLPWKIPSTSDLRFHLVAIARPDQNPDRVPPEWPGLRYVGPAPGNPFQIGKLEIGAKQVHVFDGPTIDLLFDEVDTAPDFIAYLSSRASRLAEGDDYDFVERDLLGAALRDCQNNPTRLPSVPPLNVIRPGAWDEYDSSELARYRRDADSKSRIIDAFVAQTHAEFAAGRMLYDQPTFAQHEKAMRLFAAESRFARRVIAHELYDILDEPDQTTFWASTVPSPTMPSLRYVWVTYPKRPSEMTEADFDRFITQYLKQHVLVAQALFPERLVLGVCLPNRSANDTASFTILHDGSHWTEADREQAMKLRDLGIFAKLEANRRLHVP